MAAGVADRHLPERAVWAGVGVLAAFVVVGVIAPRSGNVAVGVVAGVVAVGAAAALAWFDRRLVLPLAALSNAGVAVVGQGEASDIAWFATCVLLAGVIALGRRLDWVVFGTGAVALFVVELALSPDGGWIAWMSGLTFTGLAALAVRHERDLVNQLRIAQAGLADQARVEERNRIARELHDVIAHSLTVSLLHVTSARLAVEYDPDDAARALAEAERLGRQSLGELRTAVGALREDGDGRGTAPLPDATDVPDLVERFRRAGADVTFRVEGDPARVPAASGLGLYRILQEALTNTVRHAAGAPVEVAVVIDGATARVDVDSAGPPGSGQGVGLLSMRERAESLGGSCHAGPGGRGWLVRASIPLDPRQAAAGTP